MLETKYLQTVQTFGSVFYMDISIKVYLCLVHNYYKYMIEPAFTSSYPKYRSQLDLQLTIK